MNTALAHFHRTLVAALAFVALLPLAACHEPIATYPLTSGAASLATIAQRQRSITTIQSTATVELARPDGQSVELDAVLVARPPANLHLRASKLGRTVFDVTLRDNRLWLLPMDDAEAPANQRPIDPAAVTKGLRTMFALLGPALYESARVDDAASTPATLIARGPADPSHPDAPTLTCTIDRATLTPRRFESATPEGPVSIAMDDYRTIDGVSWPMTLVVRSPQGVITVRIDDVELNGELAPAAFTPSPRAIEQP